MQMTMFVQNLHNYEPSSVAAETGRITICGSILRRTSNRYQRAFFCPYADYQTWHAGSPQSEMRLRFEPKKYSNCWCITRNCRCFFFIFQKWTRWKSVEHWINFWKMNSDDDKGRVGFVQKTITEYRLLKRGEYSKLDEGVYLRWGILQGITSVSFIQWVAMKGRQEKPSICI